jgi:hypothetical protein
MTRRPFALLAIAASLFVAACGNEAVEEGQYQSENAQVAETEGIYVNVDEVKYQVQLSKQLNPLIDDDRSYLEDVSPGVAELADDEEWFAVWILAQNYNDEAKMSASDFEIVDTQEKAYTPVVLGEGNTWAYRARNIGPNETLPGSNDPARERSPNGAMLLFKVKQESLNNRPLELVIRGAENDAIVNLDV